MHKFILRTSFAVIASCLAVTNSSAQNAGPTAGQKVAFLGDSITQQGEAPGGYVSLVAMALEANGKKIVVIPAGISGNTSKDMLARLDKDVLSKKPDWMTLSCGVNDVWHGVNGVDLATYKTNITSIVDQATKAGIKVVILTATMIQEDPSNALNQKLVPYNQFLQTLATERHLPVVDLNADMQAELAKEKAAMPNLKGNFLTKDGVHPNGIGHEMMAAGVLKAFGLTDAQIAAEKEQWLDLPNGAPIQANAGVTVRQYKELLALAAGQGKTVDQMVSEDLNKVIQAQLGTPSPAAAPSAPATP
jgi:lysophospholipase L1-like esterase